MTSQRSTILCLCFSYLFLAQPLAVASMYGHLLFDLVPPGLCCDNDFGHAVAISGGTAVVSQFKDDNGQPIPYFNAGSVHLFDVATGNHLFELTASDTSSGDFFGVDVDIDGNIVIVGVYGDNPFGSAYLFDATTGNSLHFLVPPAAGLFGAAVAISADTCVVGAYRDDVNGFSSGSAYLFDVPSGTLHLRLLPSDGMAYDNFGAQVAIQDSIAVVSAPGDDDNGLDSGSVYLFDITDGTQLFKLTASDGAAGDDFGRSIAIKDTIVAVGAPGASTGSGAVYLFHAETGAELRKLTADDAEENDRFGFSVDVREDLVIVGAPTDRTSIGLARPGSVYLFHAPSGFQIKKILVQDPFNGATRFGHDVALSGIRAIVGATGQSDNTNTGAAYIFEALPLTSPIGIPETVPRTRVKVVPNPFRNSLHVSYELDDEGPVRITIVDVMGREVCTLLNEPWNPAGSQGTLSWDGIDNRGRKASSGAYFLQMQTGTETLNTKILHLH